ncbi:hypothetical protein EBZ80_15775 [bacterium]|nr:hypothetical protein [bacterium]
MRSIRFSTRLHDEPLPVLVQQLSPTTRFILENKSAAAFPICLRRLFRQCYTFCHYEMISTFHESSTLFLLSGLSFDKTRNDYDRNALLLLFHRLDHDYAPRWDMLRPDGMMAWWDEFAEASQEYARARREMGMIDTLVRESHAVFHRLLQEHEGGAAHDALRAAETRLDDWRALLRCWRYPCLDNDTTAATAATADAFLRSVVSDDGVLLDLLWEDGELFGRGRTRIRAMTRLWQEKEESMSTTDGSDWEELSSDETNILVMNRRYYAGIPDKMRWLPRESAENHA